MKKERDTLKKIILIPLTLVLLMSSLTLGFNSVTAKAQTDEVKLDKSDCHMIDAVAGMYVYRAEIKIKVKNIAYEKKVTVHYRDQFYKEGKEAEWKDVEASYSYSLDGQYEIWTAKPAFRGPIEYAIKYEVNGETYWDNNGWQNYRL